MSSRETRHLERLVLLLLFAHPSSTRRRYGREIASVVAERVRQRRRAAGWLAATRLVVLECAGVVAMGVASRLSRREPRTPSLPKKSTRRKDSTMEHFLHDVRIAARGFLRQKTFSVLAVVALALGIGAFLAIFSVFHAVVLRPLPFPGSDRLVSIWEKNPERGWDRAQVAAANYLDWRESATHFSDMAAHNDWLDERILQVDGEPTMVMASEVTGNFFEVLGVAPLIGRAFDDADTWAGNEPAVVLSSSLWRRQFLAEPNIVERTIVLDGVSHRIVGVMPSEFSFPFRGTDLWVPVAWDPEVRGMVFFRRAHGMRVIGRLADGASIAAAADELSAIALRLESEYPDTNTAMGNGITPLREWLVGDASTPLRILFVAVGFLLLVACANVSNMFLARASTRRQELRIRGALGGSPGRLMVEGLIESMLLAVVSGGIGLILGTVAIPPLVAMSPENLPRIEEVSVDRAVVLFAIATTFASALVFGLLPAFRHARIDLSSNARGASAGRGTRRASSFIVAIEIALTLPLVVGTGLMVRTLGHLADVDPGFRPESLISATISLPGNRYADDETTAAFYRELFDSVRGLPGIEQAAMSSRLPFVAQRWSSDFTAAEWPEERFGINVRHDEVTPNVFRTMGVPLLRGRDFDVNDRLSSTPVVIINQALADTYFPGEDPIGQRVSFDRVPDEGSIFRTIVGVVGNVRRETLGLDEAPSFYAPVLQDATRQVHLLVRSSRSLPDVIAMVRERVRAIDPSLPIFDAVTMEEVVADSVQRERFLLTLLALAAIVALLIACIGIFAVVLNATTSRVREIGIRRALGAPTSSVVSLILSSGLQPVAIGIVIGVAVAAFLSRSMSSLLFEVSPLDPGTFAAVVGGLLLAAIAACIVPVQWASRVDAASALRVE